MADITVMNKQEQEINIGATQENPAENISDRKGMDKI